jgi:hypothetical protein
VWKAEIVGYQTLFDYIIVSNDSVILSNTESLNYDLTFDQRYETKYIGRFKIKKNKIYFHGFINF